MLPQVVIQRCEVALQALASVSSLLFCYVKCWLLFYYCSTTPVVLGFCFGACCATMLLSKYCCHTDKMLMFYCVVVQVYKHWSPTILCIVLLMLGIGD